MAVRDEDRDGQGIVLGLGEHIGSHEFRVGGPVGDDQNFTGSCHHVDAHRAGH